MYVVYSMVEMRSVASYVSLIYERWYISFRIVPMRSMGSVLLMEGDKNIVAWCLLVYSSM